MSEPPTDGSRPDFLRPQQPPPPPSAAGQWPPADAYPPPPRLITSFPQPNHAPPPFPAPPAPIRPPGQADPGRRRRRLLVATAGLTVVLVAVAAVGLPLLTSTPAATPTPGPQPSATALVTVAPQPQPTEQVALDTGGSLGAPLNFHTSSGAGRLNVKSATWTQGGQLAPPTGSRYLVVDVEVDCLKGRLSLSTLNFVVGTEAANGSAFGANLSNQLSGVELATGERITGKVGFVLPAGQTTLSLVDQNLDPVAKAVIPAP